MGNRRPRCTRGAVYAVRVDSTGTLGCSLRVGTDPKFTLRVYTHLMRRDPAERARLKAFVYDEPEAAPSPEKPSLTLVAA